MNLSDPLLPVRQLADRFASFVPRLQAIFAAMDRAYAEVAEAYRFHCSGCEDNCCRSHFYHHTYLELLYLYYGWTKLEPRQQRTVQSRAADVCRQMAKGTHGRQTPRPMCPLNISGRCELYPYRPMVCRLHGIPHVLQRPDGRKVSGPGCDAFDRQCGSRGDAVLERTAHYAALASLEQEFRHAAGRQDKSKLSVAEMIVRFRY